MPLRTLHVFLCTRVLSVRNAVHLFFFHRLQRVMMLESKVFHNNLVEAVTGISLDSEGSNSIPSDCYTKELGLEILCWIAGVQICEPLRYTGYDDDFIHTVLFFVW